MSKKNSYNNEYIKEEYMEYINSLDADKKTINF